MMTLEAPPDSPELDNTPPFYTQERVKFLLAIYPTLGFSKPPQDPDMRVKVSRVLKGASWEEAAAKAADLERALQWLNDRDWRAAYVIRAIYVVGLSERDAMGYLQRQGVSVSSATVHRWKRDGLTNLCAYLNGEIS